MNPTMEATAMPAVRVGPQPLRNAGCPQGVRDERHASCLSVIPRFFIIKRQQGNAFLGAAQPTG